MRQKNKLIAYALDFTSFLISKTNSINQVILHGSISRGDFNEESDIDLFIDTKEKKVEKQIKKLTNSYYKTKKFKEWELKKISNPFSVIVGDLTSNEWKKLHRAIMNTGITLFGKYKSYPDKTHQYTLITYENIKPDKKRVSIHRKLYGFKIGKKEYPGLIEKYDAIKISKGTILTQIENTQKLLDFFKEKRVKIRLYDLWSDEDLS